MPESVIFPARPTTFPARLYLKTTDPSGTSPAKFMQSCRDCTLCTHRKAVVPGFGTWPSRVMFVGQSPGYQEELPGAMMPFIGVTGQLLARAVAQIGWNLNDYYRTNIVHCHPPGDRETTLTERAQCRKWLDQEVAIVDPDIIVLLGADAYRAFLPEESGSITDVRGNPFVRNILGRDRVLIPTLHPSAVARNERANMDDFVADLRRVREIHDNGLETANDFIPFNQVLVDWDTFIAITRAITRDGLYKDVWVDEFGPEAAGTYIGFDLETAGETRHGNQPIPRKQEITGIGICGEPGLSFYASYPDHEFILEYIEMFREFCEDPDVHKVVSNINFERHVMANYGIDILTFEDTLLQAWLLGDVPKGLKDAIHRVFGEEMIRIDSVMGKGKDKRDMRQAAWEDEDAVVEYAAQDPDASLRLYWQLRPELERRQRDRECPAVDPAWGVQYLYETVELPWADVIFSEERTGVLLDPAPLKIAGRKLEVAEAFTVQKIIDETGVGDDFNPGSPEQTSALLYGIPKPGNTKGALHTKQIAEVAHNFRLPLPSKKAWNPAKKAQPPTDKINLAEHAGNQLVRDVLSYRAQHKLRTTYAERLPELTEDDGRIYGSFGQTGTGNGRCSSHDPNLQNISARDRDDVDNPVHAGIIRTAFVAAPGNWLYAPDLSQVEMRIAAHLSRDENMIAVLTDPKGDIHDNTTRGIFKTTQALLIEQYGEDSGKARWKNMRYIAKTIGFGVLYGLTAAGLLMRTPTLKLTLQEAQSFIDGFYETYPGIRRFQQEVVAFVRAHGYYESILGRRRYFPDISSSDAKLRSEAENAAKNFPIQAGAADYFKLACLGIVEKIAELGLRSRSNIQVHDEFVLEGPKEEFDILVAEVFPIMATAYPLRVPVRYDVEAGANWGELFTYEDFKAGKIDPDTGKKLALAA